MKTRHVLGVVCLAVFCGAGMGGECPGGAMMMPTPRDPIPAMRPTGVQDNLRRWRKTNLTFFINNFTTNLSSDRQAQLITDAFNRWGAVTPLNFTRVMQRTGSDFVVAFGTAAHCELYVSSMLTCPANNVFEATTLAHAYFPQTPNMGQCHMNDATNWADERLLFSTLVHELGHALGLEHLPEMNAVMFTSDTGQTGDLQPPDITAVQRLYGSRDGTVRPQQRTAPPTNDAALNRTAPTPIGPDTDGDGLDDAYELYVLGTNPNSRDSDNDGVEDGVEAVLGLDPMDSDTDNDGSPDGTELDGEGNAFLPDFGHTGDVSAFVGRYVGTDSFNTPIDFTVAADGTVAGKLSLMQFGFEEDEELIGAIGADGQMELVSYDYYFEYEGTIVGNGVGDGTITTEDDESGTWTATKMPGKNKLPDSRVSAFRLVDDGAGGIALEPLHRTDMAAYVR